MISGLNSSYNNKWFKWAHNSREDNCNFLLKISFKNNKVV